MKVLETANRNFTNSGKPGGLVIIGLIALLFASCENFMAGSDITKSLEETIEYTNARPTRVTVSADKDAVDILIPARGSYSYKKGDPIELGITASDTHKFLYWAAEPAGEVHFDNKYSNETVASLLDYPEAVTISPVCAQRPAVEKFTPLNNNEGVCKNSSIKITFNRPVSEHNDLSKISVTMNGDSLERHFSAPEFEEDYKAILIRANKNLIDLSSGIKTVTVKIPGDFYYEEDGYKIELGQDKIFTYTINSATNEKARISYELLDNNCGTLSPNTTNSNAIEYNWGATETATFNVAEAWQFFGWKVENGKNIIDYSETDENQLKIKVVDQSTEVIKINPIVYKRPSVSKIMPEYQTLGVPKNTNIDIEFDNELSEKNITDGILNKITILVDDENMFTAGVFSSPVQNGNKIHIQTAKEYIDVTKGTKNVILVLPEELCYEKDNNIVTLGKEYRYLYRVNSETNEKTELEFLRPTDEDSGQAVGTITPVGLQKYNIGDIFTINYELPEKYRFIGWGDYDSSYIELKPAEGQNYDSNGYNSKLRTASATVKIIGEASDKIVIKPLVKEIPWTIIETNSNYGRFSISGTGKYREGDVQSISFTSDTDYQFIRWIVVDINENRAELPEWESYVEISDENDPNMTFTLKKIPDETVKLGISPLCAKRPKVVSTAPIYDSDGVYRDRRIAIMFDNEMGENALYFDSDEIPDGMTPIESEKKPGKYYAYKNGDDDSTIVYKCLSINRRTGRKDNFLKYFSEPYYDPEDKSVIRIDTLKDNPPPASTEILVTVKATAYEDYYVDSRVVQVLLGSEYSWAYYTNGKADNDEPLFGNFDVRFAEKTQTVYDGNAHELKTSAITDSALIKDNNLKSKTLWIKGEFSDGGSGPAGLTWSLRKINSDRFYPEEMDYEVDSGKFEELNIQGSNAEVAKKVIIDGIETYTTDGISLDLSNGLKEEGMYRIIFTARDKNDLTATKDFFFVYDETPPAKLKGLSESRTTSGKATVSWTKPVESDFGKIEIVRKNATANTADIIDEIPYTAVNNTTYDVEDFNRYEYTAYVYDWAGNKSAAETYTDITPPSASTITYVSTQAKDIVTVKKSTNNTVDFCQTDVENVIFKNGDTKKISNLGTNSKTHTITIKDYDYSGNCTTTTATITAEPKIGDIFYDDCYWSTIEHLDDAVSTGRNPVGIVLDFMDDNFDKAKIVAIELDSEARYVITDTWDNAYPHGWNGNGGSDCMDIDGLVNYNLVVNNKSGAINHSEVYKYLYEQKNNYNRNKIIWYLPALNEYLDIIGYFRDRRYEFQRQMGVLKSKGYTSLPHFATTTDGLPCIREIISSTIYYNDGWRMVTTYWDMRSGKYYGFKKSSYSGLKTKALYMAQVDMN